MTTITTVPPVDRAALAKSLKLAREVYGREFPLAARRLTEATERRQALQEAFDRDVRAAQLELGQVRARIREIEEGVRVAEVELRAAADPRLALMARSLNEWWLARARYDTELDPLAAQKRVRVAVAKLEALQLDVAADVDRELKRILDEAEVTTSELERVDLGWRR